MSYPVDGSVTSSSRIRRESRENSIATGQAGCVAARASGWVPQSASPASSVCVIWTTAGTVGVDDRDIGSRPVRGDTREDDLRPVGRPSGIGAPPPDPARAPRCARSVGPSTRDGGPRSTPRRRLRWDVPARPVRVLRPVDPYPSTFPPSFRPMVRTWRRGAVLMDQSSWDDTLVVVGPPGRALREAVSRQSSRTTKSFPRGTSRPTRQAVRGPRVGG